MPDALSRMWRLLLNLALAASLTMAMGWVIFARLKSRFYEHI